MLSGLSAVVNAVRRAVRRAALPRDGDGAAALAGGW